jgi:hypothetical protein
MASQVLSTVSQPSEVHFREVQRFTQPWLWAVLLFSMVTPLVFMLYGLYQQLVLRIPWGNKPVSDAQLILTTLGVSAIVLASVALLRAMRLEVEVQEDGLLIRFVPFVRRKVLWSDLKSFAAREYNPLRDYGGWGIRYGGKGKALNVSGNRGVQLELKNGERLLIGSQRADELAATMRLMQQ